MIRIFLAILFVASIALAVLAASNEAGQASIEWLGWRADMAATTLILLTLLTALVAVIVLRLLLWVVEAPRRAAQSRAESRRRQANDVLSRGFLAAAAGDGLEARRLASKAAELAHDSPGLVRVLAAQAAEAGGDLVASHAAYSAMLSFPDMRLAGHRGLMLMAHNQGDRAVALDHAEQAYGQARTAPWAWRALLEARLEDGDWQAARALLKGALDRKIVSPLVAERGRAALLAASAAQLELADQPQGRAQAVEFALDAAKLQPGFAPGVVMAARLLAADGKVARAAQIVETAWKVAPHPALWLAYRDLRTDETPRQRAGRLMDLADLNRVARESRILRVEAALIGGEGAKAWGLANELISEQPTARIAGLIARAAFAAGQPDEARVWLARGVGAPSEADWSDLDPEGRAFSYLPSDWARLVTSFAETGELTHPRHERRERGLSELPDLPISYADQAPFLPQDGSLAPFGIEEGPYEDDLDPSSAISQSRQRPPLARRRLARAPRLAK